MRVLVRGFWPKTAQKYAIFDKKSQFFDKNWLFLVKNWHILYKNAHICRPEEFKSGLKRPIFAHFWAKMVFLALYSASDHTDLSSPDLVGCSDPRPPWGTVVATEAVTPTGHLRAPLRGARRWVERPHLLSLARMVPISVPRKPPTGWLSRARGDLSAAPRVRGSPQGSRSDQVAWNRDRFDINARKYRDFYKNYKIFGRNLYKFGRFLIKNDQNIAKLGPFFIKNLIIWGNFCHFLLKKLQNIAKVYIIFIKKHDFLPIFCIFLVKNV